MDYRAWLSHAAATLAGGDSPKRDAEILLGLVAGKSRTFILAFGETRLSDEQQRRLDALLARRAAGEPIAYLTGEREFWSLPLAVSPATLIPRPDTECLVEQALNHLPPQACRLLDLGTGTGAIALALASERPDCQITGVDLQPAAVALARENASRLGLDNVHFLQGDWFSPLDGRRFAMIVSNPPYIDGDDIHLTQGDVRFEPASALVAAENGLADLRLIARQAPRHLLPGGWLLLEHGWRQGDAVRALLRAGGFTQIATHKDYGGNDRLTLGRWPARPEN